MPPRVGGVFKAVRLTNGTLNVIRKKSKIRIIVSESYKTEDSK